MLVIIIGEVFYLDKKKNSELDYKYSREQYIENIYFSYKKLLPHFILYDAYVDKKPLKFLRINPKLFYIVPYYALEKADALVGYGVWDNLDFEYIFKYV